MTTPQTQTVDALTALTDRMLIMGSADNIRALAGDIDPDVSGAVICGSRAPGLVRQLAIEHPELVVIVQPDIHERHRATVEDPFPFTTDDGGLALYTPSLADYIASVIGNGSRYAVTPTGYLDAGMHPEIKAVIEMVNKVERADVIVHLPLSHKWMVNDGDRRKVIAAVKRCRHPVAISLEDPGNPTDHRGVVVGIHEVLDAVGEKVGLWFSDLGVLDALANGGWCGAAGVTASNRHIVAPDHDPFIPRPKDKTPNVLMPEYLRYKKAETMTTDWFANGHEPHCGCRICHGRAINRFGTSKSDALEAHRHNLLSLSKLHRKLLDAGTWRRTRWAEMIQDADAAHAATAMATGVAIKFGPELKNWAKTNPPPNPVAP